MILPSGSIDKTMGVHFQKIYKTNAASQTNAVGSRDAVTISKFAALVEHGRKCAMSLPDVREDRVAKAREAIQQGYLPNTSELAAALINAAVER